MVRDAASRFAKDMQTWGADSDPECIGKNSVDRFWQMPPMHRLKVREFRDYCLENGVGYVIPSRDGELQFFAENRELLAGEGIHIMISSLEAVDICRDKLAFFRKLNDNGFSVIPSAERLEKIDSLSMVVKERYGAGSREIGINLRREEARAFAGKLKHPIFQPYIEGREFSADLYALKSGKVKGVVPRWR